MVRCGSCSGPAIVSRFEDGIGDAWPGFRREPSWRPPVLALLIGAMVLLWAGARAQDCPDKSWVPWQGNSGVADWQAAGREAGTLARMGQVRDGLRLLQDAHEDHAHEPRAWIELALYLQLWGDVLGPEAGVGQARELIDQANQRFPGSIDVYEAGHRLHMAAGDREWSATRLVAALDLDVDQADFWLRLGRLAQEVWPLGVGASAGANLERVNRFYERALEVSLPNEERVTDADGAAAITVADYFALTRQTGRAIEIGEQLIRLELEPIGAGERLLSLHESAGRFDKAIEQAQQLIRFEPDNAMRRRRVVSLLDDAGQHVAAAEQLEVAIELAGGDERDHLNLARLASYDVATDRFIRVTGRARRLFPQSARIAWVAALAAYSAGEYQQSIPHFEACKALAGRADGELLNGGFHFNYGAALERAGHLDEAAESFKSAIGLTDAAEQPERMAQALNYLGYMWLEQDQNLAEAGRMIMEANRLVPSEPSYIDSLGWYFFKTGRFEESYDLLRQALELLGDEPDAVILDHAARSLAAMGRFAEALDYSARAVELAGDAEKAEFEGRLEQYRRRSLDQEQ